MNLPARSAGKIFRLFHETGFFLGPVVNFLDLEYSFQDFAKKKQLFKKKNCCFFLGSWVCCFSELFFLDPKKKNCFFHKPALFEFLSKLGLGDL